MGSFNEASLQYANHLPDEIALEVLAYIPRHPASQSTLASLCLVSRQWYNIFIQRLYEDPYIAGKGYELFVRTICPSLNLHVRKSALASLVKVLDLTHIVHEGNKATTARLLNRTKASLQVFRAPRASFGINCWAALSRCTCLRVLDLSLPFEGVGFDNLVKALPHLPRLTHLHVPNMRGRYNPATGPILQWPKGLQHLHLSGSVSGTFIRDVLTADSHGPPKALTSLALTNCTGSGMDSFGMQHMFQALKHQLTHLEVRDLAALGAGDLNQVLVDLPCLTHLVIDSNYMDQDFGKQAAYAGGMLPNSCPRVRPLKSLTITCSSHYASDNAFTAIDLFTLIDDRVLGRLRTVRLQRMFKDFNDEEDIEGVEQALLQLDEENWNERNYQYAQFKDMYKELSWSDWIETPLGSEMAPIFEIFGGGLRRERNGNGVGGGYSMN